FLIAVFLRFSAHLSHPKFYILSLHDALPICFPPHASPVLPAGEALGRRRGTADRRLTPDVACAMPASGPGTEYVLRRSFDPGSRDRKSTRLNSSHVKISYAVFCLKKKRDTEA